LVTIQNQEEHKWLGKNVYGNPLHKARLEGGNQILSEIIGYYVGLSDRKRQGSLEWLANEKLDWVSVEEYLHWDYISRYLSSDYDFGEVHSNSDGSYPDIGFGLGDSSSIWTSAGFKYFGISETPFIRRGDSAYVIVQGPTWEEAEANAVKLGGHLVTINDAAENEWISRTFADTNKGYEPYPNNPQPINGDIYWNGFNKDAGGIWNWASGEAFTFSNWAPNRPNQAWGFTNEAVEMILEAYPEWYKTNPGTEWTASAGNWSNAPASITRYGIAEIKLAPNNAPTGTPTLSGTTKVGQVITIDKTSIQDADNFTGYTPTYNYSFEVSNDNGTTWTKLTTTDATDNNSTYTLTTAEVGKKIRGVVSYLDGYGTNESVASAGSSVITAPVVRGNSLYTIVDGPSWTQAEANSVKLGGHLVSIQSKQENDYVANWYRENTKAAYNITNDYTLSAESYNPYIGLTDKLVEGSWAYVDGSPVTYTNWSWGDTTRKNDSEDYGVMGVFFSEYDQRYSSMVGQWDDKPDGGGGGQSIWYTKGIAETSFIRRGDSAYVIVQGPTWEEAEANAVRLGGHLVTINDAAENEWIKNTYGNLKSASSGGADFWIGYTDRDAEGQWKWIDGTSSTYQNFTPDNGSTNGTGVYPTYDSRYTSSNWWLGNTLPFDKIVGEDYGLLNASSGRWNDLPINHRDGSIGIAEIKLAPNSTPTGTPTLSGTLKAGQVISIDRTRLQDADNFTGYTPDFKYSWEIAKDPGMTQVMPVWESLMTADSTDGNETFTITADLTGKLIRGVVSYLDGYGTNESVASAASSNVIAPSNTAPTALQTLRGSSKIGRVLTADKSTIVDPDGVPTSLSYGWEVSTNGTTWTTLTSADATDNNSTYALTAADLGKTIRSVISYTDGFGANEVARSAATTAVVANAKPTSISLSTSSIAENIGANKAIATLRSVDVDTDDAYTYALVSGTGSTDNSRFTIAGDKLTTISNPDFETKNSYSIRVRTTDLGGLIVDKSLVLKITNVNEAPDAISLSDTDFQENIVSGSVIASLTSRDPDKETSFTYSLTPNSALATFTDNQFFSIINDQLKINASANFEQKDSYTISVRSTDAGKLFYDQVFTLVVQDVDEAPTDISITGTGIEEGAAVGSIVGSLVSTDQDGSSTDFTYELVAGTKANNNDLFEIVGDQLKAKATFNFETKSTYLVNVRTTDESGLTFTKSITIKVNNVNEIPTDLTISATAFNENVAIGSTVATLKFVDPDTTGTYTYSLVSGVGDKDNQAFLIAGSALKVNVATNFEIQKSYSVRLRVTDQGGLFFEKSVALGVINREEKVSSAVSTTLAPDKDTLELTGTKNIFGMGNQFDNTITGNTGKNKLTGGLGKDILKGGAGVDTFFYNDLKESLLSGFDVITDYASGEKINVSFNFEGDDLIASTGKVIALNEGAIGSLLTNTTFLANNAAAFTVEGLTGTFLALNDGRDGFLADSDALIHLSKYTIGSTTPISII
jgi:hypothetical protein